MVTDGEDSLNLRQKGSHEEDFRYCRHLQNRIELHKALEYLYLEKAEIRLIKLIKRLNSDDPISCEFRYAELDKLPVYIALSYV